MKLEVKKASDKGKGVFAKTSILKGQYITFLEGESILMQEMWRRVHEEGLHIDDPLQVGDDEVLLLEKELSNCFNHSCGPNAGIRGRNELFALRDIEAGEEITFDYSTTEAPNSPWDMKCVCGAANCRHVISGVLSIPEQQREKYKELGAFPDYLKGYVEHA